MKILPSNFDMSSTISLKNDSIEKQIPTTPPITFHWEDMNVFTPEPSFFSKNFDKKHKPSIQITKNVSGIAKPGSLTAIMGASGAGKTTLLNVLNFRNRGQLRITGDVKINGSIVDSPAELSSISGYVQQDDLFFESLKVKEQLRFQAFLRMDRIISNKDKEKRVEKILEELNLKKCENTKIGNPERSIKGISGGERRRLAFGCELLTNPSLLFLDEPTSGLDSFMALSIVDMMRNLALKGKTIICTIHQPSSQIFQKFDRLCLLAEGQLAFFGDLKDTNEFFTSQQFPVPKEFNPADHYINITSVVPTNKESSKQIINKLCDAYKESTFNSKLVNELKEADSKKSDPYFCVNLSKKASYKANFLNQFKWLLWRTGLSVWRDPLETTIAFIQTIIISIILGLIYLQIIYNQSGIRNINGVLFLLIANTSFTYIIAVINSFTLEIPIFLRENQNGMYMVITYYLAKVLIDLPKIIFLPFLLTTIIYWMTNLNNDVEKYFICCVIIVLVSNTSIAFGYFLSAVSPSVNVALNLTGPLLPPLMIFSGFFLNNSTTPSYFIWLKYLSWFSYSYELLTINQWHGVTNITCVSQQRQCLVDGKEVLKYLDMNIENYNINFVAIFLILCGYQILTFCILLFKSYRK